VLERQSDEGAFGVGIPPRCPLAEQVGEEDETIRARRGRGDFTVQQLVGALARRRCPLLLEGADLVLHPRVGAAGRLHGAAGVHAARHGVRPDEGPHRVVEDGLARRRGDPRGGAEVVVGQAGLHRSRPDPRADPVAGAGHDGDARTQAQASRRLPRQGAHHVGGLAQVGQLLPVDAGDAHEGLRPSPRREVERVGARSVGVLARHHAGQPEVEPVLGVEHLRRSGVDVRLVPLHPHQLLDRVGRAGPVAGDAVEVAGVDPLEEGPALAHGALVAVQDGGPQGPALAVHAEAPHHLAAEADRRHVARVLHQGGRRLAHRAPPVRGVLLGPVAVEVARAVGGGDARHQPALGREERRLVARRAQVVGQDHAAHWPRSPPPGSPTRRWERCASP